MLKRLTVIFLCTPLIFVFVKADGFVHYQLYGLCTKVLDGDTILLNQNKVRLSLIDAPELKQRSFDRIPIGENSKKVLENLILNKKIHVTYKGRGKYGRIIGRIWLEKGADRVDINLTMIKLGQAVLYGRDLPLNYKAAEYNAKIARRGIFGVAGFDMPFYFRRKKRGH